MSVAAEKALSAITIVVERNHLLQTTALVNEAWVRLINWPAVSLFEFRSGTVQALFAPYAVTADGQRFLINAVVETEPNAPMTMVVNWAAGVSK